jgi:cyclopropane-fatty-acyl-phospholipid synthase
LTLSKEQKYLAEERVKEAGLEGRVRTFSITGTFCQHRDAGGNSFLSCPNKGRLVMTIKHVGAKHYNTYFKLVDFCSETMKRHGRGQQPPPSRNQGFPVISVFLLEDFFPRLEIFCRRTEDFMRKYMWPNLGRTLAYPVRRR